MGRTVPTFRNLIEACQGEWQDFKRALRGADKDVFEDLFHHARRHAAAGTNMVHPNAFEPIVMAILLEHEKALQQLKHHAPHTSDEPTYVLQGI
jgi:hypothetical protein